MPNSWFKFKQFTVQQQFAAMKVCTDACSFGAWVADTLTSIHGVKRVLDIGTGTGLLSLMIAQQISEAFIDAVEIDGHACLEAVENFANSNWNNKINLLHADIREHKSNCKYDVIISNPPFLTIVIKCHAATNIAKHNSSLSYTQLAEAAFSNLADQGTFFLLLPFSPFRQFASHSP